MLENIKKKIYRHLEIIVTSAVILICLILVMTFPSYDNFQELSLGFFFFFVIPALYIRLVLKKNLSDFGLNIQNKKTGIIWGILMFFASLALAYIFIKYTSFVSSYSISPQTMNNFWIFTLTLLVLYNFILFFQEFFFRGFIISSFRSEVRFWSPLIQTILYWAMVLIATEGVKKEFWQILPFAILSITGGVTAYKSRSIIYSYASGLLFLIILYAYLIYIAKIK
jgi:membrane protease YdiL (CAAX protease family)